MAPLRAVYADLITTAKTRFKSQRTRKDRVIRNLFIDAAKRIADNLATDALSVNAALAQI